MANPFDDSTNPLAALEGQGYNLSSFTYPIDLTADPGEQHFVIFYINESSNTQFQTAASQNALTNNNGASPIPQNADGTPAQSTINSGGGLTNIKQNTNRISTAIALYMPPNITTSYQPVWENVEGGEFAGAAKKIWGGDKDVVGAIGEFGLGAARRALDDAKDFLQFSTGINAPLADGVSFFARAAINPHLEMLFRTIGFREYQFEFKFTPRSEQEAVVVANIIKAFKFYASPEVREAQGAPRYYIFPAEFDIEFWSNGKINSFVNKISTCACTNVTVNYTASNGWSAFRAGKMNGVPVETNLTLQFKELEIITKKRVLQNF
jgi:hypothetical protein